MSRDSSGNYTLPAGNPVVSGTPVTSTWANTTLSDIGSELTNSIDKGGRTVWTANLPAGNYKITGLGAGSVAGDSVRYEQALNADTTTLASASTVNLAGTLQTDISLTGTTTITSFGTGATAGVRKWVTVAAGAGPITLTHSSTLLCPGGVDVTLNAGETFSVRAEPSNVWRVDKLPSYTFTLANGSASAPSLAFTTDTNTGLYLVAADRLGIAAGGTNVATFASGANITITGPNRSDADDIVLTAGTSTGSGNAGGNFTITAGDGNGSGAGGAVNLVSGDGGNSGNGGAINLTAGESATAGDGGPVNVTAGASATGSGGALTLSAGATAGTGSGDTGGAAVLASGEATNLDDRGDLKLRLGSSDRVRLQGSTGHILIPEVSSYKPSIDSGGGSGATIAGSDNAFRITVGTGASSTINVNFAVAWGFSPLCWVNVQESGVTARVQNVGSTGVDIDIIFSTAPANGTKVDVLCFGIPT